MRTVAKLLKFWFFVVLVALGVYIGIHNRDMVSISLPPFIQAVTLPSFLALSIAFVAGVTVSSVWFLIDSIGKNLRIRKLQKKLLKHEAADTEPTVREPFFQRHQDY